MRRVEASGEALTNGTLPFRPSEGLAGTAALRSHVSWQQGLTEAERAAPSTDAAGETWPGHPACQRQQSGSSHGCAESLADSPWLSAGGRGVVCSPPGSMARRRHQIAMPGATLKMAHEWDYLLRARCEADTAGFPAGGWGDGPQQRGKTQLKDNGASPGWLQSSTAAPVVSLQPLDQLKQVSAGLPLRCACSM